MDRSGNHGVAITIERNARLDKNLEVCPRYCDHRQWPNSSFVVRAALLVASLPQQCVRLTVSSRRNSFSEGKLDAYSGRGSTLLSWIQIPFG